MNGSYHSLTLSHQIENDCFYVIEGRIRAQQLRLSRKHQRAQEGSDKLLAGGGISLWPEMDRMRLSREEMATLGAVCCGLAVTTAALFYMVHGGCGLN